MCTNNVNKYKYFLFSTSGWAPPSMVATLTSGKFLCKFCKKNFQSNENLNKHGTFFHTLLQCPHVPVSIIWVFPLFPGALSCFFDS